MVKVVIFDADGMVVTGGMFSEIYSREQGIPLPEVLHFFEKEFRNCVIGKADLKTAIKPYLKEWQWHGNVDELLRYWFTSTQHVDAAMIGIIQQLRKKGIQCYLATNQEKHRLAFFREVLHFTTLFDGIFSSCELGYKKPELKFFQQINKNLRFFHKEEVLYWDDQEKNVDAAKRYGFASFLYQDVDQFKAVLKSMALIS